MSSFPSLRRQKTRAPVGLESLEGRQLMSALPFGRFEPGIPAYVEHLRLPPVPVHMGTALDASTIMSGTAKGTWSAKPSLGSTTYSLSGAGVITPLGSVTVSGSFIHSNLFGALGGGDTGSVVLTGFGSGGGSGSSQQGTLTLTLVAVKDSGSLTGSGGEQFTYTMNGTGAFASMTGTGHINLALSQATSGNSQQAFQMNFNPTGPV